MNLQEWIHKIYEVTGTPEVAFETLPSGIISSVDFVQSDPKLRTLSRQDVTCIIRLCLCITHVAVGKDRRYEDNPTLTPDCRGLALIDDQIKYLITSALDELKVDPTERNHILSTIEVWFHYLQHISPPPDRRIYTLDLGLQDPPFISLFYHAWQYSLSSNGSHRSLFYYFFYNIYKALRILERSSIALDTFYSYLRAVRFFYQYIPLVIKDLESHPNEMPYEYIDRAIARIPVVRSSSGVREVYKKELYTILLGKEVYGRDVTDRLRQAEIVPEVDFVPADGTVTILSRSAKSSDFPISFSYASPEDDDCLSPAGFLDQLEVGGYVKIDPRKNVVPRKPSFNSKWQSHISFRSFQFHFDSSFMNNFHYSLLYHAITRFGWRSSAGRACNAFILLSIHTGIQSKLLINLLRKDDPNEPLPKDYIALIRVDDRRYIVVPAFVYLKTATHDDKYEPWSEYLYLPVPDPLSTLLDLLPRGEYVFTASHNDIENGDPVRLTLSSIDNYFQICFNSDSDKYYMFPLRFSLSKICGSFLSRYKFYGFDAVKCCHISGRDYQHSFKSRAQYRNIPHRTMEKEYLQAFSRVHNAIIKNMDECIRLGFISEQGESFSWLKAADPGENTSPFDSIGYGSAFCPTLEHVQRHLAGLIAAIKQEKDILRRYNLYTAYVSLGLQATDGLRPRIKPQVQANHVSRFIKISDKHSKRREERIVPMQATVAQLLSNLAFAYKHVQLHFAKKGNTFLMGVNPSDLLFFVNNRGIDNFTPGKVWLLLKAADLDPDFSRNILRHYLMSYLYRNKFSDSVISAIVGHHRAGQEFTGKFSSSIPSLAFREAFDAIDVMLREIGFIALDFPILEA